MLEGALVFQLETEDRMFERLAIQVSSLMLSSGNYKKSTKAQELMKGIYAPLIPDTEPTVKKRVVSTDKAVANQFVADLEAKFNM